ncbi:hypothetical protein VPNG_06304 [Cytospora leucostoma]|uniref:Letm1 RBD domain-containing protein n=1 Tax=Cytospora leucostoma TaxID=1230097 RepID=A0A423X231_9PEZI|nr:hypothetical protein VPNG_06304 [Cytospora leucostoma]
MISTTQLRILRTFLHTSPTNTSARFARRLNAPTRRIQQPLPAQPSPCASQRLFSTSKPSRQKSHDEPQPRDNVPHNLVTDPISPAAANPPSTTRPAPLDLPTRKPDTSTFSHLFATGKAYLTFYKTGLRHIYINTRLVWSLNTASGIPASPTRAGDTAEPPAVRAAGTTRSTELLRRRWAHDVRRLPVFALVLLVCGEFTPLVVLALPRVVPITCRIPQQVEKLRRGAEERHGATITASGDENNAQKGSRTAPAEAEQRAKDNHDTTPSTVQQEYTELSHADITAHLARSLNLISPLWDKLLLPDTFISTIASRRVRQHLAFLDRDNHFLAQAGGVSALEDEEVLLASEDRGIWPVEKGGGGELLPVARENLQRWLYLVGDDQVADPWSEERAAEREARMVVLMTRRHWPRRQSTVRSSARILLGKE